MSDRSATAGLPSLREVQLCDNEITDVAPLSKIPKLKVLLLANNPVSDFSPLDAIAPGLDKDF